MSTARRRMTAVAATALSGALLLTSCGGSDGGGNGDGRTLRLWHYEGPDSAMGVAWASNLGEGETFTTLELKINFLKPVWTGRLEAVATVMKPGRTQGLVSCEIRDEQGSLVAFATSTCLTLRGEMARGR